MNVLDVDMFSPAGVSFRCNPFFFTNRDPFILTWGNVRMDFQCHLPFCLKCPLDTFLKIKCESYIPEL